MRREIIKNIINDILEASKYPDGTLRDEDRIINQYLNIKRYCTFKRYEGEELKEVIYIDEPYSIEKQEPNMIFIRNKNIEKMRLDFEDKESRDIAFKDIIKQLEEEKC